MKNINQSVLYKEKKISLLKKFRKWIYYLFRIKDKPVVKIYNGYGNNNKIVVMGHAVKISPMSRKKYRSNWITNTFAILRLFMVKTYSGASLILKWDNMEYRTLSEKDGFFIFDISPTLSPAFGWHRISVQYEHITYKEKVVIGYGSVYIPFPAQHGFISDIDDTFLISHTAKMRRRLYVLFTKNARTRKTFDGVIHHYQALAAFNQQGKNANPFFYVSSSEWNLYDFIDEFARFNQLPRGVFLLNQLKQLKDFYKSGQNNHSTKFMRIVRVLEAYPHLKFVLLGDDSQQDPNIYSSVVKHFPEKIIAVYIRQVHKSNYEKVSAIADSIREAGVHCCYFKQSAEAMIHSRKIDLAAP